MQKGGNPMMSRNRLPVSRVPAKRSTRSLVVSLAAVLAMSTMLCGCIVEPGGYGHGGGGGWWWHHHDDR
jgi:hypothetical protein